MLCLDEVSAIQSTFNESETTDQNSYKASLCVKSKQVGQSSANNNDCMQLFRFGALRMSYFVTGDVFFNELSKHKAQTARKFDTPPL